MKKVRARNEKEKCEHVLLFHAVLKSNNNEVLLRVTNHTGQVEKNPLGRLGKIHFTDCPRMN